MSKLKTDAVIARIIRETRIESQLAYTDDIIKEIVSSQLDNIKERIAERLPSTIPGIGTFRIVSLREEYHTNYLKLRAENPDIDYKIVQQMNRAEMKVVLQQRNINKKRYTASFIEIRHVTLVKKDG